MARIRTIKPEFWTSEQVARCLPNTRLLFIGLWTFCDDAGRHPASLERLKMEVFPADNFDIRTIGDMVKDLIAAKLIVSYRATGKRYWQVTGWEHQKIDQPTFRHPGPDGKIPCSPNKRRTLMECSPPESSRVEGITNDTIDTARFEKLDWAAVAALVRRQIFKIQANPTADNRRLVYTAAALVLLGVMPEAWFTDAVDATVQRQKAGGLSRPMGHLTTCLANGAKDRGQDFRALRRQVSVPAEYINGTGGADE